MSGEMRGKGFQLLGLAMRAGKLVTGEEQVVKAVRAKRAKLVLLAEDAAANTRKKIEDKCKFYEVPLLRAGNRAELGRAIGKRERVVIAVLDEGFATSLQAAFSE
ncbi:YlxQ family RNA-binding protein [Bacillaceae bacterium]